MRTTSPGFRAAVALVKKIAGWALLAALVAGLLGVVVLVYGWFGIPLAVVAFSLAGLFDLALNWIAD